MVFVFFFSSRRRHTRWPRDWSSDVCSSDLCLEADVYDPGDGKQRTLAVEVAGQSEEISWTGGTAAVTAITRQLSLPGGAQTLVYQDLSPSGVQVIVDRLVLWPAF